MDEILSRSESRLNTDRFPKRAPKTQVSSGVQEHAHPRKFFGFLIPKGPFPWVSESFRQDIGKISTWNVFFFFILKNIFIMEFLIDYE